MLKKLMIGSVAVRPAVLMAPMAGFTDWAFRQILRRFGGVGLLCTEMVGAPGVMQVGERNGQWPGRLWGAGDEPRPLAVQIWDNDPATLADAGRRLVEQLGVSVVDVNFGCPAKAITSGAHSGSYLLRDPQRVGAIVARLVEACAPAPVTAKIRLGLSPATINAVEVAQAVESAGAAALTVHGRTAADRFAGRADWDQIARIRPHLRRMPLIGNGDLQTPQSVVEAFERYGVDGVMIGRAALSRPWLFRQIEAALAGEPIPDEPTLAEQRELLLDHYAMIVERFGPQRGTILMRRFACRYAQACHGARRFRRHVAQAATPDEFAEIVRQHFPQQRSA